MHEICSGFIGVADRGLGGVEEPVEGGLVSVIDGAGHADAPAKLLKLADACVEIVGRNAVGQQEYHRTPVSSRGARLGNEVSLARAHEKFEGFAHGRGSGGIQDGRHVEAFKGGERNVNLGGGAERDETEVSGLKSLRIRTKTVDDAAELGADLIDGISAHGAGSVDKEVNGETACGAHGECAFSIPPSPCPVKHVDF